MNEARERSPRSEKMRQERAKEAKELIQNRPGDAKKLFTRNSSQGQMNLPGGKPPTMVTKTNAVAPVPSNNGPNQPTSSTQSTPLVAEPALVSQPTSASIQPPASVIEPSSP